MSEYVTPNKVDTSFMTLRDYFAAEALQGILAADVNWSVSHEKAAEWAYAQADAMLEERNRER
jgi:hypothetical protein